MIYTINTFPFQFLNQYPKGIGQQDPLSKSYHCLFHYLFTTFFLAGNQVHWHKQFTDQNFASLFGHKYQASTRKIRNKNKHYLLVFHYSHSTATYFSLSLKISNCETNINQKFSCISNYETNINQKSIDFGIKMTGTKIVNKPRPLTIAHQHWFECIQNEIGRAHV